MRKKKINNFNLQGKNFDLHHYMMDFLDCRRLRRNFSSTEARILQKFLEKIQTLLVGPAIAEGRRFSRELRMEFVFRDLPTTQAAGEARQFYHLRMKNYITYSIT